MSADDQEDEAPDPLQNPDGTRKPDLRYTKQERGNVRVERQMDGSGHLARGDKTRMSVLNFSSRHQSRTERDPEFEFRPAPRAEAASPPPEAPASPAAEAAAPSAPDPGMRESDAPASLLGRMKKLFGL
jgi:hypothetical protein